jgi:hypothetical protein
MRAGAAHPRSECSSHQPKPLVEAPPVVVVGVVGVGVGGQVDSRWCYCDIQNVAISWKLLVELKDVSKRQLLSKLKVCYLSP